ncbi:hypothetical protein [uncultured Corynebacterium sp.]|uniref:hypothetical protein n=1 Tax=uncultured Corynebacterium sp. TaxID=159447 RepID=UPI0025DA6DAB|nr:hypothetical protein [uncultured Corynebacterium sp.]
MIDDDQPDLNLAESAPMHLDTGIFDGLLDYAVSADAHDVDDSLVPYDTPSDAPVDDDLDSIALSDDADDPLAADPLAEDAATDVEPNDVDAATSSSDETFDDLDAASDPLPGPETDPASSYDDPIEPFDPPLDDPADPGQEW